MAEETRKPRNLNVRKPSKKAFSLLVLINDEVFTCQTDDLKTALKALAPRVIKTRVIIKVANKFSKVERIMNVFKARLIFRNDLAMSIFVRNISLTLKNG